MLESSQDLRQLLVLADGLLIEEVVLEVLNRCNGLVLLINFGDELGHFRARGCLVADSTSLSSSGRSKLYEAGGRINVSCRVLILDLLTKRLSPSQINGLVVNNAESIREGSNENFVIHMFVSQNPHGFIWAFSQNPEQFSQELYGLEKIVGLLKVDNVHLFPRFHLLVKKDLEKANAHVEELGIMPTFQMKKAQACLLGIMEQCLKEIVRINPVLKNDPQLLSHGAFERGRAQRLKAYIQTMLGYVSPQTRAFLDEIKDVQWLLTRLYDLDSVSYHRAIDCCKLKAKTAAQCPNWFLSDNAGVFFQTCAERINRQNGIDEHPKWKYLLSLINRHIQGTILIMVSTHQLVGQLKRLLTLGYDLAMDHLYQCYSAWAELNHTGDIDELILRSSQIPISLTMAKSQPLEPGHIVEEPEAQDSDAGMVELEVAGNKVYIDSYRQNICNMDLLNRTNPQCLVLYNTELSFLRTLEVYCSSRTLERELAVYLMVYKNSMEEQRYLDDIRIEKEAFEKCIREKSSLAKKAIVAQEAEGHGLEVVVDTREFQSTLPFQLYRAGFQLFPETLKVGDYVVAKSTCIERKTIVDLASSLSDGRLFNQIQVLVKTYPHPFLLLEFESGGSLDPTLSGKLVQLILAFKSLQILWSNSYLLTIDYYKDLVVSSKDESDWQELEAPYRVENMLYRIPHLGAEFVPQICSTFSNLGDLAGCGLSTLQSMFGVKTGSSIHSFFNTAVELDKKDSAN